MEGERGRQGEGGNILLGHGVHQDPPDGGDADREPSGDECESCFPHEITREL